MSRAIIAGDWVGGRVSDGGRVNKTRKVAFLTRTRSSRSVMISVLYVRYKPPYHPQKTRVKPPEVMRTDDIQKDILGGTYGYLCSMEYRVSIDMGRGESESFDKFARFGSSFVLFRVVP